MIICDRCGWVVPVDCTCRRHGGEFGVVRMRSLVANRHRESVARAHASARAHAAERLDGNDAGDPEDLAAG